MRRENWDKKREIALGAIRSYLRSMDIDPLTVDHNGAARALDDLSRLDPYQQTIAVQFCHSASQTQIKRLYKDWEKWRKNR